MLKSFHDKGMLGLRETTQIEGYDLHKIQTPSVSNDQNTSHAISMLLSAERSYLVMEAEAAPVL